MAAAVAMSWQRPWYVEAASTADCLMVESLEVAMVVDPIRHAVALAVELP